MENKGNMVLILDGGILDYDGLLDALLNNGYTITMDKVGACLHLNYIFKSDKPQNDCSKCETYWNCQGQCDEIPQINDEWQIEREGE